MNLMLWAGVALVLIGILGCALVLTERVRMPLSLELGVGLMSLGMLVAGITVLEQRECAAGPFLMRAALVGGGLLIVVLSMVLRAVRARHPLRRRSDWKEMAR